MKMCLSFLIVSLFFLNSTAVALSIKSTMASSMEEYLSHEYPHVFKAITDGTYDILKQNDLHLMFKEIIDANAPEKSYAHSMLVGAEVILSEFPTHIRSMHDFSRADLSFAHLTLLDLSRVKFFDARAHRADFSQSILHCKNIRGLDVMGANLSKTSVIVLGVQRYVTKTILAFCGVVFDEQTLIISPLRFKAPIHS